MATQVIIIEKGNTADGTLQMSDRGRTRAGRGDSVIWQIDPHSGVGAIVSIQEKSGADNIWSTPPHRQGANWTGTIRSNVSSSDVYVYSITWNNGSSSHVYDPIISIKPSTFLQIIKYAVFILVSAVLALFTLDFLRRKKMIK